jgi:hypothetical protein
MVEDGHVSTVLAKKAVLANLLAGGKKGKETAT